MYLNFFILLVIDFPAIAVSCYCLQRWEITTTKLLVWKIEKPKVERKNTRRLCEDVPFIAMIWECGKSYLKIEVTILHFIKELPKCWFWSIEIAKFSHNRRRNCWDTFLKWGTSENKTISVYPSPLPSIRSWGVCCFSQVARTAAYHRLQGVGEGKFHLTFLKVVNCCKGSLSKSV